ncbi:MAG: hypothetical protein IT583_05115 [Verrucomicrobia bacterium]|nr:hypothetical protein [Verrucomicrobiota bacterium]
MKKIVFGLMLMAVGLTYAMPSYDDVLLVVNDLSPQSLEIGAYFKAARNLPDVNVCHISVTDLQATGSEAGNMALSPT